MERLEYSYLVASLCQVACTGKTCRTCADNSNSLAVGSGHLRLALEVCVVIVSCKSFQTADSYSLALLSSYALALALVLLGAYTTADCGEGAGLGDNAVSALKVTVSDLLDKAGDINIYGAARNAGHSLAVETSLCLVNCDISCIAQCYL
ncbi:unknown [Ruminococcus sp. CAG:353]|nr:unknown [Ruminococcus sp. CAG:353]